MQNPRRYQSFTSTTSGSPWDELLLKLGATCPQFCSRERHDVTTISQTSSQFRCDVTSSVKETHREQNSRPSTATYWHYYPAPRLCPLHIRTCKKCPTRLPTYAPQPPQILLIILHHAILQQRHSTPYSRTFTCNFSSTLHPQVVSVQFKYYIPSSLHPR